MPNSRGHSLRTSELTRRGSIINNFLFYIYLIGEVFYSQTAFMTKETGGSAMRNRRGASSVSSSSFKGEVDATTVGMSRLSS